MPYLLRDISDVPVYGTPFTLELLKGKLEEHQVSERCELRTAVPGEGATVGPFSMRFLRVTHSIPDGMAVVVDTPYGAILHTGDFKIDQTPLDGRRPTCTASPRKRAAAACTCCSATPRTPRRPATPTASAPSARCWQRIVENAPNIVVAACFSSHIHRVQQIVNAARANERVVAFLGPVDAELGRRGTPPRATCRSTTAT